MQANRRFHREGSWLMFSSEFNESTLHEKGSGEYDPTFVISKLGAKVNRLVVAGLLEKMETRETSTGATMWNGSIRDAAGLHYFGIGDFSSDSLKAVAEDLTERSETGALVHVMIVAKARWYQNEEGAVYTSLRPEEISVISKESYQTWLAQTAEATLMRLDAHSKSMDIEPQREPMMRAGLPEHLVEGLIAARNHYHGAEVEQYRLHILQALDIAEGKMEAARQAPAQLPLDVANAGALSEDADSSGSPAPAAPQGSGSADGLVASIMDLVGQLDQGEGAEFEIILKNLEARGYSREEADSMLSSMADSGQLSEARFGWFSIAQ